MRVRIEARPFRALRLSLGFRLQSSGSYEGIGQCSTVIAFGPDQIGHTIKFGEGANLICCTSAL